MAVASRPRRAAATASHPLSETLARELGVKAERLPSLMRRSVGDFISPEDMGNWLVNFAVSLGELLERGVELPDNIWVGADAEVDHNGYKYNEIVPYVRLKNRFRVVLLRAAHEARYGVILEDAETLDDVEEFLRGWLAVAAEEAEAAIAMLLHRPAPPK